LIGSAAQDSARAALAAAKPEEIKAKVIAELHQVSTLLDHKAR
jgi:hypothetical protein